MLRTSPVDSVSVPRNDPPVTVMALGSFMSIPLP